MNKELKSYAEIQIVPLKSIKIALSDCGKLRNAIFSYHVLNAMYKNVKNY